MACLDSVVTLGLCGDAGASTSGFQLIQAAGISKNNLANIADEDVISGASMALQIKEFTLVQVRNDFIGALQTNQVVATVTNPTYDTSYFLTEQSTGTYNGNRGVWLHKAKWKGQLRKTTIEAIHCYPLASGDGTITIQDGINEYTYDVTFVANQENIFDEDVLSGFPFELSENSSYVKVLINQTDIAFAKSKITCMVGCNGSMPNPCGWAEGWDGAAAARGEGYGINVRFKCECDYERILCDLSKSFSGELIWWKWQANVFREQLKSNRFNGWVVYNHEELPKWIDDAEANYNRVWNNLMQGMLGILKTYRDDCLNCRGTRWRTNV